MSAPETGSNVGQEPGSQLPNLPLLEDELEHGTPPGERKPVWRGWIHAGTFPLVILSGIVLVSVADGAAARWSTLVYAASAVLLFGVSATYHRFDWKPRTKRMLKRFDHANIFLLIAGTYTPIAVLALPPQKGWLLLGLVWAGALAGIAFRMFWLAAPRWLYVPLYMLLGWAAVMYVGDLFVANVATMVLVILGGLAYTIGAAVYALKRPDPAPDRFGFHEIFHALTVVAFLCHWAAVLALALMPPVF